MVSRIWPFLLSLSVLAAPSAHAEEITIKPVPSRQLTGVFNPDPEGVWRTITQTDATSDCIGDPVTPMCAVDTRIACGTREDYRLCEIAEDRVMETLHDIFISDPTPDSFTDYRIVSVRSATPKDIGPFPEYTTGDRQVGDLLIAVISRNCIIFDEKKPRDNCVTYEMPMTYSLRQVGKRWTVIHYILPRW